MRSDEATVVLALTNDLTTRTRALLATDDWEWEDVERLELEYKEKVALAVLSVRRHRPWWRRLW